MLRILSFTLTILISTMVYGQDTSFDKKVESLFFNVDVSNTSVALIDKFIEVHSLNYINPDIYSYSAGISSWTHVFTFTTIPDIKSSFDTGFIVLTLTEINRIKQISSIEWKLRFDDKENAVKAFEELQELFTTANVKHRNKKLGNIEVVEFTADQATKYPNVSLAMYKDNKSKRFQIFFALDNDMHNGL